MRSAGNDTASAREDELVAYLYRQVAALRQRGTPPPMMPVPAWSCSRTCSKNTPRPTLIWPAGVMSPPRWQLAPTPALSGSGPCQPSWDEMLTRPSPSCMPCTTGRWCGWPPCWCVRSRPPSKWCTTRSSPCVTAGTGSGTRRTLSPTCGRPWCTGLGRCCVARRSPTRTCYRCRRTCRAAITQYWSGRAAGRGGRASRPARPAARGDRAPVLRGSVRG